MTGANSLSANGLVRGDSGAEGLPSILERCSHRGKECGLERHATENQYLGLMSLQGLCEPRQFGLMRETCSFI